jgi:hypothetical protein
MTTDADRKRVVTATFWAAVVAIVLLIVAVLPAEYGIDPTGAGRALGLTALAEAGQAAAPASGAAPAASTPPAEAIRELQTDTYEVELRPFEGVEYKYRLAEGDVLVYSWQATAPVEFEFHGEPDGAPADYFDSYIKGDAEAGGHGDFAAPTSGVHGWYWKNNTVERVTVALSSAGFYPAATEYRDGERTMRLFGEER